MTFARACIVRIGQTYEFNPTYRLQIAVAQTDMGGIRLGRYDLGEGGDILYEYLHY